ncbi:MAG: S8 family serine peptidase, partial [Candidatus Portiera sp.]|nr:S8 family serine peptidase [Portiera sp.]
MTSIGLTKLPQVEMMIKLTQRLSITLLVAGLIACGGGGSSSSPQVSPTLLGVGNIANLNDFDLWEISLEETGALTIYTTFYSIFDRVDTVGVLLFNATGEFIAYNDDAGGSLNFRLCSVLEPGAYIVNVSAYYDLGNYNIHTKFDATKTSGYCGIDTFNEWTIEDYGIRNLHAMNITGEGVNIAIVDDGLEIGHEDLRENVLSGMSYNYLDKTSDPTPEDAEDSHGTAVAGIVAARSNNGIGITGVAGRASIYGYNLLVIGTDENDADAMTRNGTTTHISSNSWGPPDRATFEPSSDLWQRAIKEGLNQGASGKGISYIWAAGNGRGGNDNSNYDGYANFYGVMAVCAVGKNRRVAPYSEPGANLWLCGPSDSRVLGISITTTDLTGPRGSNQGFHDKEYSNLNYTNSFGGTSAAAPFISGVVALMRQVNPALTWRDVKLILAESSDIPVTSGVITGAEVYANSITGGRPNYKFHHDYGFGIVNPTRAVEIAKQWQSVPVPFKNYSPNQLNINLPIPDAGGGSVTSTISVRGSDINFIEYVEIGVSINHTYTGDLDISLRSPSGKTSDLAHSRICPFGCGDLLNNFRFGSAIHLGESADGEWSLQVTDQL